METIATHHGHVVAIHHGQVRVQMQILSACATCEGHSKCGFAEKKDKIVDIQTSDWKRYRVGDSVTVAINSGRGLLAVLIAYVLPAVLLLAAFTFFYLLRLPELWVALLTLLVVALYGIVLYLFRNRLQKKFTFQLRPAE